MLYNIPPNNSKKYQLNWIDVRYKARALLVWLAPVWLMAIEQLRITWTVDYNILWWVFISMIYDLGENFIKDHSKSKL
jgi:hypothetical protein